MAAQTTHNSSGPSSFTGTIEKGGRFEPEKGRYHLFVAYGGPWAARAFIAWKVKALEDIIGLTVVSARFGENGWAFAKVDPYPGVDRDPLYDSEYLKDLYYRAEPTYSGKITVPMLWDKKTESIVNNESADIVRIFNTAFNQLLPADKATIDLYPEPHRQEIDEVNEWTYETIHTGVYKAGWAKSQNEYEDAVITLFESVDRVEKILSAHEYLVGNTLTEADIRLFVTIIRFDAVYHGLFKCNLRTIRGGYPAIHLWLRKLYWNNRAFSETLRFDHVKTLYYSLLDVNPRGIVPLGPFPDILPL
ncbi:glutathione S-transferase [Fomes fomentarius]|nr:glutathione S-transferase [Fomes fomentarius]